jgi:hypothetical protein
MKLRADVLKVLADWKAGKPVRSLELGHVHRMKENPGSSPMIDISEHHHQDQERAHAYCFHIIEHFKDGRPGSYEEFSVVCDGLERDFKKETEGLTAEELDGAESLAWKALLFGWSRAIDGHKDANYIEVARPQVQESAT